MPRRKKEPAAPSKAQEGAGAASPAQEEQTPRRMRRLLEELAEKGDTENIRQWAKAALESGQVGFVRPAPKKDDGRGERGERPKAEVASVDRPMRLDDPDELKAWIQALETMPID